MFFLNFLFCKLAKTNTNKKANYHTENCQKAFRRNSFKKIVQKIIKNKTNK